MAFDIDHDRRQSNSREATDPYDSLFSDAVKAG